jgi:hypothetical protein
VAINKEINIYITVNKSAYGVILYRLVEVITDVDEDHENVGIVLEDVGQWADS